MLKGAYGVLPNQRGSHLAAVRLGIVEEVDPLSVTDGTLLCQSGILVSEKCHLATFCDGTLIDLKS